MLSSEQKVEPFSNYSIDKMKRELFSDELNNILILLDLNENTDIIKEYFKARIKQIDERYN